MTRHQHTSAILRAWTLSLLGLVLVLGAGSAAASDPHPVKHAEGQLWQVEREGQRPSYLFALFYYDDPALRDLPAPVMQAFGKAEQVSFSFIFDEAEMGQWKDQLHLPAAQSLRHLLDDDTYRGVVARAERYNLSPAEVDRLAPSALSHMFSFPPRLWNGFGAQDQFHGRRLVDWAQQDGKLLISLEDPQEVAALQDSVPVADYVAALKVDLAMAGSLEDAYANHLKSYRAGRVDFIAKYNEFFAANMGPDAYERIEEKWIFGRNRMLAKRLSSMFESGATFAGLQAFQLPGEKGVLSLLEKEGYRVTRLY
ncbi:TraB/GumN family protein [Pelagibius marinus]|uniref:TraB/GumN family protein n=1 Tax=Pelagibius marinus TaxID=2762760 RepID=UPI0018728E7D|nr:TraB/GumN family protein [Pelagibius marinus]